MTASRLEALAEPGGIWVSRMVRDKLDLSFEDMGEQQVKNITRPVRAYRVVIDATGRISATAASGRRGRVPRWAIATAFTNLSDDREQQYFADGITQDLTTDLSRLENMFVISCNTAFTYRNKPLDTRRIGRELGVRYVLEGSIRRSDSGVRITAQLIGVTGSATADLARAKRAGRSGLGRIVPLRAGAFRQRQCAAGTRSNGGGHCRI